jgi:hypothetical protein
MYDKQTINGRDEKKQQQWEEKIKKMLGKQVISIHAGKIRGYDNELGERSYIQRTL